MKVSEILLEANRNKIILVDFQPAYDTEGLGYQQALDNAVQSLNKMNPPEIICFFNGEDVGIEDTAAEVMHHYIEYGLDENLAQRLQIREKSYAWLRNWMDQGVDASIIIKVVRFMVAQKIIDSRDIEPDVMQRLVGDDDFEQWEELITSDDAIFIPEISIGELKTMSGCLIGGGGQHECLKEIQLLMNAFNIKYKQVADWTYGG
jgi:hypothetical protein